MRRPIRRAVALALILTMLLASCAEKKTVAATMFIQKTEGDVSVEDGDGKDIKAVEGLGLYNGYSVATRKKSYGWIDLDKVKLAKLDEKSEVEIHKHKRKLELVLYSGGLFFDVTEPLKDDETMTIRTTTMLVGIRGTCGWVYCEEDDSVTVALLRGKVECSVLNDDDEPIETEIITAGERASLIRDGDDAEITVTRFKPEDIPEFVKPEIEDSDDHDDIIAILNGDDNTPAPGDEQPEDTEDRDRREALLEALNGLSEEEAMYARLGDLNGDGIEDLLTFGHYTLGFGLDFAFTAHVWDPQTKTVLKKPLTSADYLEYYGSYDYSIYRDKGTGTLYAHYSFGQDSFVGEDLECYFENVPFSYEHIYDLFDYPDMTWEQADEINNARRTEMHDAINARFELVERLNFSERMDNGYGMEEANRWREYWREGYARPDLPPFYATVGQVREALGGAADIDRG